MPSSAAADASWSLVSRQRKVDGGPNHPTVRYSASSVEYRGELVVTHGYFYNHALRHPAWQSDAWAFNFASQKWRRLHAGEAEGAPSARYSCSGVIYQDALWLFGGDDGGHKRSMFNYIFGAWFDELWRFDLRTYAWQLVRTSGTETITKRALHSAVVIGDSMYVYGGLEKADLWRYDFRGSRWALLDRGPNEGNSPAPGPNHPGRRHAFAAAATPDGKGFYLFGGCRHVKG